MAKSLTNRKSLNRRKMRVGLAVLLGLGLSGTALCLAQSIQGVAEGLGPFDAANNTGPRAGVSYRGGQLSIRTEKSTLAEVLKAVAEKTGTVIDIPEGSGGERIVEHAGPGPADEVLAQLLNGSAFNFVIVTSPGAPHVPTRVVLMLREGVASTTEVAVESAPAPANTEPQLYGSGFSAGPEDESSQSSAAANVAAPTAAQAGSSDWIPGDVLDQMQKDRLRQRRQQQQSPSPNPSQ